MAATPGVVMSAIGWPTFIDLACGEEFLAGVDIRGGVMIIVAKPDPLKTPLQRQDGQGE